MLYLKISIRVDKILHYYSKFYGVNHDKIDQFEYSMVGVHSLGQRLNFSFGRIEIALLDVVIYLYKKAHIPY